MESTRPIRALTRGLDALTVLNVRGSATVSEVASEVRLPRTTVHRILATLCNAGFVARNTGDDRYRPTIMVRSLSAGFDDETWVTEIARPCIEELGRGVLWPVSVSTIQGTAMMVRDATDRDSPLTVERYSAGFSAPLLDSAAGPTYLAFCPAAERDALIESLELARSSGAELRRVLADSRSQGYATTSRSRRLFEEISLSVPVTADESVLACLTVRFDSTALPLAAGIDLLFPKLRQCAAKMSAEIAKRRPQTRRAGAELAVG